ncbi:hypothetical protein ROT00_15705 [Agromyces mediolanus]|uniref:hypothetical protein n=1 Tax=Agromyces mediolanus TaxID=41986 RepID=UPI003837F3C1
MTNDQPASPAPDATASTLLALARALYPHDGLPDGPYERAVALLAADAAASAERSALVAAGAADAATALGDPAAASLEARTAWLEAQEDGPFFAFVRERICYHLYDDREVWQLLGYPGPSYALGGYLHRGFDELPWLPEPRVEEAAEPLVEIGPLGASAASDATASTGVGVTA